MLLLQEPIWIFYLLGLLYEVIELTMLTKEDSEIEEIEVHTEAPIIKHKGLLIIGNRVQQ